MNVACPNCRVDIAVPEEVLRRGVARVTCKQCSFTFVIRLGDPGQAKPPPPQPAASLEGVKSSGSVISTAGEISKGPQKFLPAETRTTIVVDPELQREIDAARRPPPPEQDTSPIAFPPAHLEREAALASAPTEVGPEEPTPVGQPAGPVASHPTEPAEGFESFRAPEAPVAPPPGAELPPVAPPPAPPAPAAPTPDAATLASGMLPQGMPPQGMPPQGMPLPGMIMQGPPMMARPGLPPEPVHVGGNVYATQPVYAVYAHPSGVPIEVVIGIDDLSPRPSGATKALGVFMLLVFLVGGPFLLFVLYQNDWSLDLANFGTMMSRAFGGERQKPPASQELRGLELDPPEPILDEAKLSTGERVVLVKGVVKNNDTRARRFIYVRVWLRDGRGQKVIKGEAPAGNVFSKEQLAGLDRTSIQSHLNPGGSDGRNQRVEPGQTVAYMVVLSGLPADYARGTHTATAEVTQAEIYQEP